MIKLKKLASNKTVIVTVGIALVICAFFFAPKVAPRYVVGLQSPSDSVIELWGDKTPPGVTNITGVEKDKTRATDVKIAGHHVVKLGNVSSPELHIYQRDEGTVGDAAVVICPGGGFTILAWDLEGVEVAKWLNSIGVTAGVLKYRVPTLDQKVAWHAPVQDSQRAISVMRELSEELGVDKKKVGVMGFSAGGIVAARTGLMRDRQYEASDEGDQNSCVPDFMMLIYASGLIDSSTSRLKKDLVVDSRTPPTFIVHTFDDPDSIDTPVVLLKALKAAGVLSELHVYDAGGHGYGLRKVNGLPVTTWPDRCQEWLQHRNLVAPAPATTATPVLAETSPQ